MTFDEIKQAALAVLEYDLRDFDLKSRDEQDRRTRAEVLDGLAHDIAGRIDHERM